MEHFGRILVAVGLGIAVLGGLLWSGALKSLPFGKLPGDVSVQRDGFRFEAPIASMLVISLILTLISWAVSAFRR